MRQCFFDEGMLNEHYVQLEELELDNPHFAEEVMNMFFRDSTKLIATLERALVGAAKVWSKVNTLREILKTGDIGSFGDHFAQLKTEHERLQVHLGTYFQMLRQVDS
ncbi:histidine-containing phosphotransfer protein 4-like [Argentina anserina]|uniref:histidine-containing phosphotransfer protein 4-like n=1 Tax=Argentina anserina TaxID=57926 RepID=UPI0021767D48|nr:histidine-containing phosphotransfer protein 4-like [Potentilla anserina]